MCALDEPTITKKKSSALNSNIFYHLGLVVLTFVGSVEQAETTSDYADGE